MTATIFVFYNIPVCQVRFPRRSFVFNDIRVSFFQFLKFLLFPSLVSGGNLSSLQNVMRGQLNAADRQLCTYRTATTTLNCTSCQVLGPPGPAPDT
jgi:hypothetical protein